MVLVPDVGFLALAKSTELRGGNSNAWDAAGIEIPTDHWEHKKNGQTENAGKDTVTGTNLNAGIVNAQATC